MDRAAAAGVPTFAVALADHADRAAWNAELAAAIAKFEPDLVVLAGFMRVLAPGVVSRFRIVNTHPALLPAFPGAHAVRDALAAGVASTGVTVHWVDEGVDTGPVIAQAAVADRAGRRRGHAARPDPGGRETAVRRTLHQLCQELSET